MDSTRVAMLVPAPLEMVAGGHIYDHRIAAGLRAAGCQVTMAAVAGRHPLPDAAAEASAQAIWAALPDDAIPVIDGSAVPAFAPLGEALARRAVGLIHHPVSMETGLSTEDAGFLGAIERRILPMLGRIVVTSPETASALTAAFGVEAARVSVVVPGTEAAPRSVGSGGPGCAILSIGTLLPRKGHEVLLRALARLFDLDWHLTIAGEARDLTTEEAAKLIGVSRPTLIRLLDSGAIPYRRTNGDQGHRRISRRAVLDHLRVDLARRRQALDELAADAEAFGFFDE